ncbi:Ig-like domain-containing protein [Rhizobium paknamense]|nr:Ig-like domain-containing protein [Rhizobium paknamense]
MKNRAGWLALGVLAIATVLMVFFVLPQIRGKQTGQEQAQQQTAPVETPSEPAAPAQTSSEAPAAKMARLKSAAEQQVTALEGLFADGKTPAPDAYSAAKLAAMTALKALADQDIPAGLETGLAASATKAKEQAAKALAFLASLPASPADAAAAIADVGRTLRGEALSDPNTPRFDVLRVEKDGSTVIAGSAAPGSKVEVVDGNKPIASATASQSGDFAIVLDQPLPSGDHALDLRATTKDGAVIKSEEQATVSVPANSQGDVLAMVSKPGEASRLLSTPDQINDAAKQGRVPAATAGNMPAVADSANTPADATRQTLPAALGGQLQITAVELEGNKIFVAGNAPKGRAVSAFVDSQKIGDSDVDQNGKFVVEGELALAVGQHIISVDLKDASGKVTLRASVPFNRPEGDQVAVVAPQSAPASGGAAPVSPDRSFFDRQRDTLAKSFTLLSNLFADGKTPDLDALAAARSATEFALKAVSDFRPAPASDADSAAFMSRMAANAGKALAALKAVPSASIPAMADALPKIRPLVEAALEPMPQPQTPPATLQAQTTQPVEGTSGNGSEPPTISQAPLTASPNTVIIRRGDTLWQISRRVYGQGVRYTTIYMANAEQITNPDLIEPGQTFNVPDQSLPDNEAEAIHRKWMLEHKR